MVVVNRVYQQIQHKPWEPQRVGIYARVSSRSATQLQSIAAQVSGLTQFVARRGDWKLVDVYLDFASGSSTDHRNAFQRMMDDAEAGIITTVVIKSIQRFGRDTVDNIQAMRDLVKWGCEVYFQLENISSSDKQAEFISTLYSALAQADNESRANDIRWGIKKRLEDGTSGRYRRTCYGYMQDANGMLVIDEPKAEIVRLIYQTYLDGASVIGIKRLLEERKIPAPLGGATWPVHTIEKILSNEKYYGTLVVFRTIREIPATKGPLAKNAPREKYCLAKGVEAIISEEAFIAVQEEKKRRTNLEDGPAGRVRKKTRYTWKRDHLMNEETACSQAERVTG